MIPLTVRARQTLLERRRVLRTLVAENEEERKRLEAEVEPDWPDRALSEESRTLLGRLSEAERLELEQIEAALSRIDRGGWGKCEACGGPIEDGRLAVMPEARLCIGCSTAQERASQ